MDHLGQNLFNLINKYFKLMVLIFFKVFKLMNRKKMNYLWNNVEINQTLFEIVIEKSGLIKYLLLFQLKYKI